MWAKEIAFFLLAFVVAGGIINGAGIFDTVTIPEVEMPGADLADGIVEAGSSGSESDVASAFDGWTMISSMYSTVKIVFSVLVLPGPYLASTGAPIAFAYGIQTMISLAEVWGLMQLVTNRSTGGMD
ncbi:MAG: hypothetical protein M0R51_05165 [Clostridia bacterium]|jgi:hypothetical protein|nr:hypothetical protein [Clostridia bacterium]